MNTKATLTALFGIGIVTANITAAKIAWIPLPVLGQVAVPAGFIAFGFAFLMSDLLVEHYGKAYAKEVVQGTVVGLIVAYGLVWVAIWLPSAPFYNGEQYASVLGGSAAVVIASVLTIAISQPFDVWLFARLKQATQGRHKWLRNCVSTGTSQILDTVVFISLAFWIIPALQGTQTTTGMALVMIIVGQYVAKLVVVALDTPVFYVLDWVISR
jgi:uncharacterized integral membrane protein (TIGR00697 family)